MIKHVVSLGAGHGGFDLGTIGPNSLAEKDVTLFIQNQVSGRLAGAGAFEVLMVRAGDQYIPTSQRVRMIEDGRSRCHVELHVDLSQDNAKSAAVWYSADTPSDRFFAARLSHRLSKALGVPDCGARVRFDYCMLFQKLSGFEDYYAMIEAVGASPAQHIFYCECGIDPGSVIRGRAWRLAAGAAEAVARTICELFAVNAPAGVPQRSEPCLPRSPDIAPVFLKEGLFNLRAGPGSFYPVIRVIEGLIYSGVFERRNGWVRLSEKNEEYISEAAVDVYLNAAPPNLSQGDFKIETTTRGGFYFVLTEPRAEAEILGAVGTGTSFLTAYQQGYRKICYCDRTGFIGPSAWEQDK